LSTQESDSIVLRDTSPIDQCHASGNFICTAVSCRGLGSIPLPHT